MYNETNFSQKFMNSKNLTKILIFFVDGSQNKLEFKKIKEDSTQLSQDYASMTSINQNKQPQNSVAAGINMVELESIFTESLQ